MQEFTVRIHKAVLDNFKNVEHGVMDFACNKNQDYFEHRSDILGIYGQNGSGKTAFIQALDILKTLLTGNRLPNDVANYITVGEDSTRFMYEFSIANNTSLYKVIYEFTLQKMDPAPTDENDRDQNPTIVASEKLSYYRYQDDVWSRPQTLIEQNYFDKAIFKPKARLIGYTHNDQNIIDELRVAKKYTAKLSTSFIFSKEVYAQLVKNCSDEVFKDVISALVAFGQTNLHIIDNRSNGLINANVILPFSFKINTDKSTTAMGVIPIALEHPSYIPESTYSIINGVISTMNTVLCKIIPGLSIELGNLGKQAARDGKTEEIVELFSIRDNKKIAVKYESDGIKKIISILHMLIYTYNNPSMTLAIDELDAGIFEYLLGEMLKIIEESGKGQLIFTSHNLRPLEAISKTSIVVTTTNPKNRYFRLTNVKTNNNLRDFYYHDIVLGGQKECIYEPTNSFAIGRAFRLAGEANAL
jgi:AAA15 family ATPase/GTPase